MTDILTRLTLNPMDNIRAELQRLRTAPQRLTDEEQVDAGATKCALNGVCTLTGGVLTNISTKQLSPDSTEVSDEILTRIPQLADALERILILADQLGEAAKMREQAARDARTDGRYDLSESYHASARRMRATQRSLVREITNAFQDK